MYNVEQYTITRPGPGTTFDDKSAAIINEFETEQEARAFYDSIDIANEWNGERMCRPAGTMKRVVFCKELYYYDEAKDKYGDTMEYAEYTYNDYQKTM